MHDLNITEKSQVGIVINLIIVGMMLESQSRTRSQFNNIEDQFVKMLSWKL